MAERPEFEGIKAGNTAGNIVNSDNSGINITGGGKTVVIAGDKVDFGGNTLTNVAPGAITNTSKDAVNGSQLYNVQAIATKGWNIQTNGDVATQVQPGDTVDIGTAAGENNIKVTRNGNTIDFELNKNLDLGNTGSVKMGDLTINNAGLVIKNGPSVTINGIDAGGKTITDPTAGYIETQLAGRPCYGGLTLGAARNSLATINEEGISVCEGGKWVVLAGDNVGFRGNA